jgi:uncharacterized Zn-binding protein involved in type VI secretion
VSAAARRGDLIVGGAHGHGHPHGPLPTPGRIVSGAAKVRIEGRPAARAGDEGYSPLCCGGIGKIVLQQSQGKVFIEGRPAAAVGTPALHCGMAPGQVKSGSRKVRVP